MEKIWYIKISGKSQGPFSVEELRCNKDVTPNTLVRKEGASIWMPLRLVPELRRLFKDRDTKPEEDANLSENDKSINELVLEFQQSPPPIIFWVFLAIAVLILLLALVNLT